MLPSVALYFFHCIVLQVYLVNFYSTLQLCLGLSNYCWTWILGNKPGKPIGQCSHFAFFLCSRSWRVCTSRENEQFTSQIHRKASIEVFTEVSLRTPFFCQYDATSLGNPFPNIWTNIMPSSSSVYGSKKNAVIIWTTLHNGRPNLPTND